MRYNCLLLVFCCVVAIITRAQETQSSLLNIGDPAPPLRVREWLKGTPVQRFEKGKVYVVEFWATWCKPCVAAMTHLSALAREYKEKVIILGIDIMEMKTTPMGKIRTFVDSMGQRMDYVVAAEDSNFMVADWLDATGERRQGIPRSFVVNAEGRLAWMGYPKQLDEVLSKIMANTWDMKEALAKRNENIRLEELDHSFIDTLNTFVGDLYMPGKSGRPDFALSLINEIVTSEPKLKYAPFIASHTFSSLLKTDPYKAYKYGKEVLITPTYEEPAYDVIIGTIEWYADKLNLPAEIYELGAEAYQVRIDYIPYPEITDFSRDYHKMAEMYFRAKDKAKAISAIQKAIEALKSEKDFSKEDVAAFESRLQQYKNM